MFKQILLAFTTFFSAIYANKDTTYTDFYIALRQSNVDTLKSTLLDISNPKSAKYGKFLDTEYVNKLVSPPQEEKQLIYNWLETNDIKVIKDYGDCIKSYGSLKSIDNIFGLVQRAGSAESAVHSRRIECHGPRAQRTQRKAAEAVTPFDC